MDEIEALKEDIIERYSYWVEDWETIDNQIGYKSELKNNFRNLVEHLVSLCFNKGSELSK